MDLQSGTHMHETCTPIACNLLREFHVFMSSEEPLEACWPISGCLEYLKCMCITMLLGPQRSSIQGRLGYMLLSMIGLQLILAQASLRCSPPAISCLQAMFADLVGANARLSCILADDKPVVWAVISMHGDGTVFALPDHPARSQLVQEDVNQALYSLYICPECVAALLQASRFMHINQLPLRFMCIAVHVRGSFFIQQFCRLMQF